MDWNPFKLVENLAPGLSRSSRDAARMAGNEMAYSQLPGRRNGPGDAYSHILWAAELTRRFGEVMARCILTWHEWDNSAHGQGIREFGIRGTPYLFSESLNRRERGGTKFSFPAAGEAYKKRNR